MEVFVCVCVYVYLIRIFLVILNFVIRSSQLILIKLIWWTFMLDFWLNVSIGIHKRVDKIESIHCLCLTAPPDQWCTLTPAQLMELLRYLAQWLWLFCDNCCREEEKKNTNIKVFVTPIPRSSNDKIKIKLLFVIEY